MRVVADYLEILIVILVDRIGTALDTELGERARVARELQPRLFQMVGIKVAVAPGPDERSRLEPALLCQHVSEESVAGDVEGDAQEHVGAALIELEVELAGRNLRLEQAVAGGER